MNIHNDVLVLGKVSENTLGLGTVGFENGRPMEGFHGIRKENSAQAHALGKVSEKTMGNVGKRQEGLKNKGLWDSRSL